MRLDGFEPPLPELITLKPILASWELSDNQSDATTPRRIILVYRRECITSYATVPSNVYNSELGFEPKLFTTYNALRLGTLYKEKCFPFHQSEEAITRIELVLLDYETRVIPLYQIAKNPRLQSPSRPGVLLFNVEVRHTRLRNYLTGKWEGEESNLRHVWPHCSTKLSYLLQKSGWG